MNLLDGDDGDYVEEFAPDGIDTLSDDFYNINSTNFNRTPQVKSLLPRTPKGIPRPNASFNKPRYNLASSWSALNKTKNKYQFHT